MTQGKALLSGHRFTHGGPFAASARRNGIDLNKPIKTIDGDTVKILAVDDGHPFPIVGEIYDFAQDLAWLARFNTGGIYRGTPEAQARHSLARNVSIHRAPTLHAQSLPDSSAFEVSPASPRGSIEFKRWPSVAEHAEKAGFDGGVFAPTRESVRPRSTGRLSLPMLLDLLDLYFPHLHHLHPARPLPTASFTRDIEPPKPTPAERREFERRFEEAVKQADETTPPAPLLTRFQELIRDGKVELKGVEQWQVPTQVKRDIEAKFDSKPAPILVVLERG